MPGTDRASIARDFYRAFAAGDRNRIEALLAPGFAFFSPPDPGLDRVGYFERCWPHAGNGYSFDFVRLIEAAGDELIVTYEATRPDGSRFRNTEILGFDGERVAKAEVYFGWNLE
ncbi:MAG TPA: nuclear transport factor 2 family protein [Solirubrobacteraceae bacterium]|jgi:ketosteroid isomerase-like protein